MQERIPNLANKSLAVREELEYKIQQRQVLRMFEEELKKQFDEVLNLVKNIESEHKQEISIENVYAEDLYMSIDVTTKSHDEGIIENPIITLDFSSLHNKWFLDMEYYIEEDLAKLNLLDKKEYEESIKKYGYSNTILTPLINKINEYNQVTEKSDEGIYAQHIG